RKEIYLGYGVGTVGLGMDADDLPAQVVGVRRRFLRVPRHPAWSFVDGCVTGSERIRVVAGRHVEIAFAVEGNRATGVTALQALSGYLEENFFRREVEGISFHLEASEHVLRLGAGGRVIHVDPTVLGEAGIGGESQQAVLGLTAVRVFGADGDRRDPSHATGCRRIQV